MWYSQKNTCVGVFFLLRLQVFRRVTLEYLFWRTPANGCFYIFGKYFLGRFSNYKLAKGTFDNRLLCEKLLKSVTIEQKCFLSENTRWGEKRLTHTLGGNSLENVSKIPENFYIKHLRWSKIDLFKETKKVSKKRYSTNVRSSLTEVFCKKEKKSVTT